MHGCFGFEPKKEGIQYFSSRVNYKCKLIGRLILWPETMWISMSCKDLCLHTKSGVCSFKGVNSFYIGVTRSFIYVGDSTDKRPIHSYCLVPPQPQQLKNIIRVVLPHWLKKEPFLCQMHRNPFHFFGSLKSPITCRYKGSAFYWATVFLNMVLWQRKET